MHNIEILNKITIYFMGKFRIKRKLILQLGAFKDYKNLLPFSLRVVRITV